MLKRYVLRLLVLLPLLAGGQALFSQKNDPEAISAMQVYLKRAHENGFAGSVLVASGGQILLHEGYGQADREARRPEKAETVFCVGSITKQFTAAAIMKLWSQGKVGLDDPLSKYFPEAPADKGVITVHQLLTHTAGLADALGDDYDAVDAAQFARLTFAAPLDNKPGEVYQYSNVGFSLLGIIVEKVSGQSYDRFLREQLWLPAGMKRTGYLLPGFSPSELAVGYRNGERWGTALDRPWLPDGPGWHLRANGGVLSTAGDMYLWYKALKNNTVLPKSATDKLFAPHVAEDPAGESFYGYGWVVQDDEAGRRIIWHNGGNGVFNAYMGFDLARDVCIVVSSNSNDKISDRIAHQLARLLDGQRPALDATAVRQISGRYRLPSGEAFDVKIDENDRLTAYYQSPEVLQLLLADGSEDPAQTAAVGQRTTAMLEAVRKGDFSLLAQYRGMTAEAAQKQIKPFWDELQADRGQITGVTLSGVVARPKAGLMLAFVRVEFERAPLCFFYIWKGEQIDDVREMAQFDKVFEWQNNEKRFYAANNGVALIPEKDGAALLIRHAKGETRAVRAGD